MVANRKLMEEFFNRYNKEYFGGKLPQCSFGTNGSFKELGYFSCYKNLYKPGKYHKFRIIISYRYDLTEAEFKHILLHEMLHLYLVVKKSALEGNLDHGHLFLQTMNEFNKKYNLNIAVGYSHAMKRAPGTSRLLWWWHNQVVG